MKVSESEPECDFCGSRPPVATLNDGLWWVCQFCYADVMDARGEEE